MYASKAASKTEGVRYFSRPSSSIHALAPLGSFPSVPKFAKTAGEHWQSKAVF